MTRPVAVIVGTPGAGKTAVGTGLAGALGVAFRDTDADIEATSGRAISDIFVQDGEPVFRELERVAVAAALKEHDGVLALGGGAILDPQTRLLLAGHDVVWLQVDLSQAVQRVGLSAARPLLLGNVRSTMLRLMQEREPLYREVATIEVDTSERSVDEVVAAVAAILKGHQTRD